MPHYAKPDEGSWTEHYPQLGTGPVSYEDSISPEHYELERKAIFEKTWLNVGRVEQLPRVGSYFSKEIDAARTSIVVVRSSADEIRAFHNMCRHRGNKLVWQDYPGEETSGTCRQFTCKYHGWRYSLEGDLTFVQQEGEFFDLDKSDYGLAPVRVETWEGFIFVNLDTSDTTPLRDYLGELGQGTRGLPVRRDDAGLQVPRRGREQLEAVHRRLHRVLPRTRVAREAGGVRRVAEAPAVRLRSARLRDRRTARDGVVVGRHVAAEGSQHGEADRARAAQRPLRSVGARHRDRPAAGGEPGASPRVGYRLVPVLPELHGARLVSRTGTSRTTTGRRRTTRTSSRARATSCRRRTRASVCSRSSRR